MVDKLKKILVAEDERPMAKALKLKFEKAGFDVTTVFNGQEAIDALSKKKFDLMLLDIIMPKVNGFGVLEAIKKNDIKIKVIITSNLSQEVDVNKALSLGASDFFIKSNTSISDVVEKVKLALVG